MVDPSQDWQGIQVPVEPEVQAAIDAAVANPAGISAAFSFTFQAAGATDPWGDTCLAFPAQAQTALITAAAIWTTAIQSPVPITISACWSDLGSTTYLGYSGWNLVRDFTGAQKANTWYASALANALHGSDLLPFSYDDYITYNSNTPWYFGTDGIVPAGEYDLVTAAAHDMAHGLNFSGFASYSGGTGSYGGGTGYPNIYDTFMEDAGGTKLTTYTNPSMELGSLLTSGSLWFDGINANAANGGMRVKIYAPSAWVGGASYMNLDYSTFAGTAESMMVYKIDSGSSQHNVGPVTKGLLKDLGWVLAGETPLYVKPVPSGAGNCQSWGNACSLQTALANAVSGKEIWVAAGTYLPTTGTERSVTFQLKIGVALYGGFAGTETERTRRDPTANVTTLSGDIGTPGDASDNSYHVVTGANGPTLDGFTISNKNANGDSSYSQGGGMYNANCSPTLTDVTFSGNSAGSGSGMDNSSSSPILTSVTFTDNTATNNGGGVNNENSSNPTLANVTFSSNSANYGGGMFNDSSSPILTNVTLDSNPASYAGGGMWNQNSSNPTVTNITFSNNSAEFGGGMGNGSSSATLTGVTFNNNSATAFGGGIYNYAGTVKVANSTLSGNSATYPQPPPPIPPFTAFGGGIYNYAGTLTLTNSTMAENSALTYGGAIFNNNDGVLNFANSIIAYSSQSNYGEGCISVGTGIIATNINNLVSDGSCSAGGINFKTDDPLLVSLADDGGPTWTYALGADSPAIDAGDDGICSASPVNALDQRGVSRP